MNQVYLALPFVQFIVSLFLAGVVVLSDTRDRTNRLFALFLLALAVWGIAIFVMRDAFPDHALAYEREKVALAVIPFSSIIFYHFVLNLTKAEHRGPVLTTAYGLGVGSAVLSLTGQTATGMTEKFYGFAPELGWAFPLVLLAAYPPVVLAIIRLTGAAKAAESEVERRRLKTLRLGALASVLGGTSDFIPSLGLNIYPMGVLGNIFFGAITTFALTRYRLMNLRLAARQGLVHALMSTFIFTFYGVALLAVFYLGRDLSPSAHAFTVVAVIVLAGLFVQPGLSRFQAYVDRVFFRERSDRLHALGRLNEVSKDITDLAALSRSVAQTVRKAVQADWAALALPDRGGRRFVLSADTRQPPVNFSLPADGSVALWLMRRGALLRPADAVADPLLQSMTADERSALGSLGAEVVVPLVSKGSLAGLLAIGPRLVGTGYAGDDLSFVRTAASQTSVALENARMYAASQREARERAALADLAQVVNSTLEINAVYERCAQQVRRLLHGEGLTVTSLSDDLGTLTYEYSDNAGGPGRQTGHVEDLASSPLREVVTSQKGIVFGERATGQSGHRLYDQSASAGVRSMVAVPLLSNNRVIGTLDLESRDDNAYGPEELALAERAGALVANAIANAQLYQQALQLAEERELRARAEAAARELERVAEAKSEFLSTVSHELKTPLTSIIAFTDILLRQRANALDEKDVRHLEVIKRNGRRLSLLIEDLLDVSRIDMGTLKVERDWFDIREVLSDLQESFGPILEPKRQTLTVSVPPDALVAFADRNRITQVVSNLLSNASKYSPADRSIEVRARDDDGKVHVEIQDHGYGISAEDQAKLFTPFFRVSNDTVRAIPGTGLGLVIAKGIIELHGGQVSLESEPGKGTTVRFHILREPAAAQDSEKVA